MDASRLVELYASEARENLALLSRSILAMESPDAIAGAVGEAFRAAHTLKGMAATMGHAQVTDLAHAIEDRLEALRTGTATIDATFVDALLAASDVLSDAIDASLAPDGGPELGGRARIRLHPDTPLMGARALLITLNLTRRGLITRTVPESLDADDFDGDFVVELASGAERGAVEAVALGGGDVESVTWLAGAEDAPHRADPVVAVRVDPRRLDALAEGIGELTIMNARNADTAPRASADRVGVLLASLRDQVVRLRMLPVSVVFERLPLAVREAARAGGREVRLQIEGSDVEFDRGLLDELGELLVHLIRNAVGHGIETPDQREAAGKTRHGTINVWAERDRAHVRIVVKDDGRGIPRANVARHAVRLGFVSAVDEGLSDDDLLRVLTAPGFSTADRVTELSGRGVGLDVVAGRVRTLGGSLTLRTEEGAGTTFTMRLPATLALAPALRVRVGTEDYAIPLTHVTEALEIGEVSISDTTGREQVLVRNEVLPLFRLGQVLGAATTGSEPTAVITEVGDRRAVLAVDALIGRERILIKQFDGVRGMLPMFSGATLLADGRPALVLDPLSVVQ